MSSCCNYICSSLSKDSCITKLSCAYQKSTQCCSIDCYCRWSAAGSCAPVTRVSGTLIIMRAWPYLLAFLLLSFICCCLSRKLLTMEDAENRARSSNNVFIASLSTSVQDTLEHDSIEMQLEEILSTTGSCSRILRAKIHYSLHTRGKILKRSNVVYNETMPEPLLETNNAQNQLFHVEAAAPRA